MARLTFLYGIWIPVPTCLANHGQLACIRAAIYESLSSVITHDYEVINLISKYPDGIRLSQLMDVVADRYGRFISFQTSSALGMDLDGLLRLLESRDKVRIVSGVVYPGASTASGH
jgi:probable metal-binding protein